MYRNKYCVEMKISRRLSTNFSLNERKMLEDTRVKYNNYFVNATIYQTKNKKYISKILTKDDVIQFYLETEYPIINLQRIGNALRMYAIMASTNELGAYISNQRLMRSA